MVVGTNQKMGSGLTRLSGMLALLLGGCISTNTPGDLTLQSVTLVDWTNQPELPGPNASPLIGMVSDHDLVASGQSLTGGEKWHRPLLKIEFTSATDLSKFTADNSYNIGVTAYFCDHEGTSPLMGFPYVFSRGARLNLHDYNSVDQQRGPTQQAATYYIFIDVSKPAFPQSIPPQEAFNLRQQPSDVCFYARGGNGSGRGYRSNTVVITKDVIASELQ